MRLTCSRCGESRIEPGDRVCPNCGLSLTVGAVLADYWQRFRAWFERAAMMECPGCRGPVPIQAKTCPECGVAITVEGAVKSMAEQSQQSWPWLGVDSKKAKKRIVQWVYFLLSAALLWSMLAYAERHYNTIWVAYAFLSVFYLAVLTLLSIWIVPRHVFRGVSTRASGLVKVSLACNYLSVLLVLQILIVGWWMRALLLAGLIVATCIGAWVLYRILWPMTERVRQVFQKARHMDFDASNPQGRKVTLD